jgi:acyl-coenzyme A synthetase/AMP-(fatty) acid ligase
VRDDEGYLYFVARADEMIKTRGFRVSPMEVESGLTAHEQIDAAVAFGVENIKIGEDIACAYTTTSGEAIPEKVLMQALKDALPRHMVPLYLVHFESFPITGNDGKFDRKAIKLATLDKLGLREQPAAPEESLSAIGR